MSVVAGTVAVAAQTTISELGRLLAERPGLRFRLEVTPGMTGGARYRAVSDTGEIVDTWLLAATLEHVIRLYDQRLEHEHEEHDKHERHEIAIAR